MAYGYQKREGRSAALSAPLKGIHENHPFTAKAVGNRYRANFQMISAKSEARHGRDW